jgi:hypothetical protein
MKIKKKNFPRMGGVGGRLSANNTFNYLVILGGEF